MKTKFVIYSCVVIIICVLVLLWFVTLPSRIQDQMADANYCEADQDCVNFNYGVAFGCGNYVNRNRGQKIQSWVSISNLLHPSNFLVKYSCEPVPKLAVCIDKKCMPKQCDIGVYYSEFTLFADRECDCPKGTIGNITEKGMICSGIEREPILMPQ
ncbi:MAG: hypothetical protein A3E37_01100 [Candidatus Andersenbacteria bacterium RIFCSPHIGHO2_12_FULL_46_9]|nr:MAG: hypothetical protein A3B76_00575 [Candidatus Andersenbacteria bacterium RIFCSPHIGHO2_02_FULL_46_16]OGY37747.1 MAG: hypothetical protein A3E37_01100 [Candidatus Andersenbacteria bacterium RIFCSPHIGHO2_12_FULL_46_9]OGY40468.1 MAG: hypothetical protein A3G57_01015 [Candidatus Andersenbacteria bacterium RIFCSPLOWO2_12_FULL_45_8]HBE90392.1 hypothetical protein [Candidatus Andersenbacteria bacterium]